MQLSLSSDTGQSSGAAVHQDDLILFMPPVSVMRPVRQLKAVTIPEEAREFEGGKSRGLAAQDTTKAEELGLRVALREIRVEEAQLRARILERVEYEAKVRDLHERVLKLYNERKATKVSPICDEAHEENGGNAVYERALTVVAGVLLASAAAVWCWSGMCASQLLHEMR